MQVEREREREREIRLDESKEAWTRMDSEARREIDLITPTLFHSRLGKGRRRPGSKGGREKERRGEKKTEGGYDLIRGTPFVHPPSSGNHSNGEGCIFYSRAVCLVRDEYERVRVQRIHRRKGREGRRRGDIAAHARACVVDIVLSSNERGWRGIFESKKNCDGISFFLISRNKFFSLSLAL